MLSGVVAWLLARRIIGPVAAASAVAERIARGNLEGEIPGGRGDELGTLLTSMGVMRDNIKTMMEREVLQRRSAQARLADALGEFARRRAGGRRRGTHRAWRTHRPRTSSATRRSSCWARILDEHAMPIEGLDNVGTAVAPLDDSAYATGETRLADGRWLRISRSASQEGGFIIVCSDISVMKEQKLTLTATNLRLDAALDNMSQGLCLYDANNRLSVVNRRFSEMFNLPPERIHRE